MKKYTRCYFYVICKVMRIGFRLVFIILLSTQVLMAANSAGQTINEIRIDLRSKNKALKEVLDYIEQKSGFRFVYNIQTISAYNNISVNATNRPVSSVLNRVLSKTKLTYIEQNNKIIVFEKDELAKMVGQDLSPSNSQDIVVKGKVTSASGEPLPGVSVKVKNTAQGTSTDESGHYSLQLKEGPATLVFSYLGFETAEVPVGSKTTIDVILRENIKNLDEVVVIGYGTQRRADVTSAVATVKAEDFVKGPVLDAGQLLQGKVAGLSVSTPSGDPTSATQIVLRGNTTLYGANSNPLVLIDGIPGDLKTVAPEDIESVDVLKDGSAAAIYGTRGTNGVIIVTTRRASGKFTNSVEYSGYASTQSIARQLKMLTAADYRQQIADGTRLPSYDLGSSTNWMDEITRTPVSHVHNLTFRGGSSTTNYLANVNYRLLQGIFRKSDNNTFSGRVDINHFMFDDKLKVNIGILNTDNSYISTADGISFTGYTYRQALIYNPTSPVKNADGTWAEQPSFFNYENPMSRLYESDGENSSQNTRLNSSLTYTPVSDLRLSALFSYNRYNQVRGYAETKQHISTLRDNRNGYASNGNTQSQDRLLELTAQYSKNISDHRFTVLGGYSYQDNKYQENWMQNWDFPTDIFSYNNIELGDAIKRGIAPISGTRTQTNLISFFGRATYSYKDRYMLLANYRYEAASQLYRTDKPWGAFPAISAGWHISEEPFMKDQHLFDDLKLRVGYGVTGSQPTAGFLGVPLINYSGYVLTNGKWVQPLIPTQNSNPYLRWEEKKESNFGLDYSLYKGRISGNIDYYIRKIDGLLYDYQVPSPPNLYSTTRANVGIMENKGLEVMLNLVPLQSKTFVWNTSFNFSTNTNKLKSLSNELYKTTNNYFTTGETGEPIQTFTHIVNIGDNIGDFYGFKVVDITDDGKWIYEGRDGNPVNYNDYAHAFEDKRILGNGLPKYYAGWNNTLKYKNMDLSITMRGAFSYQILNYQRMYYENTKVQEYNRLKSAYDKVFDKAVLSSKMPLEFNSYYIEDGDFWKIDNITLGYSINKFKTKYIRSLRFYATSLNTFLFTGYKGIDPEVDRLGLAPGNDYRDKYPTTRTFTLGVNLSF